MKLFGVNVSGLINKYVSPGVFDAILTKITEGTRTSGSLTAGTNPASESFTCRGFIDQQSFGDRPDAPLVNFDARTVVLIGDSIQSGAVPQQTDQITIEGLVYSITKVARDPAAATYSCLVSLV